MATKLCVKLNRILKYTRSDLRDYVYKNADTSCASFLFLLRNLKRHTYNLTMTVQVKKQSCHFRGQNRRSRKEETKIFNIGENRNKIFSPLTRIKFYIIL